MLQLEKDDRSMTDAPSWVYSVEQIEAEPVSLGNMRANVSASPTRIGELRPSHLVTTGGVGAIVDLPSMSVMVRGLDAWSPEKAAAIIEPRLLDTVRGVLGPQVRQLRAVPFDPSAEDDPWSRTGVPVTPFPALVALPPLLPFRPARPARPVRARPPLGQETRPGQVGAFHLLQGKRT